MSSGHNRRFFWGAEMLPFCGIDLAQGYRKIVVPLSRGWEMVTAQVDDPREAHRLVQTHRAFYQQHLDMVRAELCFGYQIRRDLAPMRGAVVFRPIFWHRRARRVGVLCNNMPESVARATARWAPLRRSRIANALCAFLPADMARLIASFAY